MSVRTGDGPARVLVVDADGTFLDEATRAFDAAGHATATATTVADGLSRLDAERIDAVVSGRSLPDGEGVELLRRVRDSHGGLPFVLVASDGTWAMAGEAVAAGVTGLLSRSTDDEALDRLVDRVAAAVAAHRDEQRRRRIRERYELVARASADAIWDWNVATDEVARSQGFQTAFGYDAGEVEEVFDWWAERIHPGDRRRVIEKLDAALETGAERYRDAYRFRMGDGSYGHVESSGVLVCEDGEPVRMVGTLRNETDRVVQRRRFQTIVETVPDGVYTTGPDGEFTMMNEAFADLLGGEVDELLGRRAMEFVAEEDRAVSEARREQLRDGERDLVEVEFDVVTLDGSRRRVENRFTRLPGEPFAGTAGVVRDITQRTARVERLNRQNERLEEFSAVLSHDLRNPLNVALGSLELVAEGREDDRDLVRARRALRRMDELIDRLRALARAGRDITDPEPVSLDGVVAEAWSMVDGEDAELRVHDELGTLPCDRRRTGELFENLFRNAVEHASTSRRASPEDVVEHASTSRQEPPDDAVEHAGPTVTVGVGRLADGFYVEDDGPGIPTGERDRILAVGHTTAEDGTGLGLNIVATVAEAHGWAVDVGSSDAGGARFEFTGTGIEAAGAPASDEVS